MNIYSARVVDQYGKKKTVTEEAISRHLFEQSLSDKGFYIIDIKETYLKHTLFLTNNINKKFVFDFTYNIYTLLDFGIDINEVFRILSEIYQEGKESEFIRNVISYLKKGERLSTAIKSSKYGEIFDDFFITMVSAGEHSGKLKDAFRLIYSYTKTKKMIREKLISASVYPALLLFVSFIILNLLMFMIIPMIEQMYLNMDYVPVLFIKIVFNISHFLKVNTIPYIIFLFLLTIAMILFLKTKISKQLLNFILHKAPIVSKLTNLQSKIKTSFSLEILLKGGYSMEEALQKLSDIENDNQIKKEYLKGVTILKEGAGVRNAFKNLRIYDTRDLNIIEIADSISKSPEGFEKIHTDASSTLETYLATVFELLNPVILIFMGFFVFFIMYLVVSPTLEMLKNLQ